MTANGDTKTFLRTVLIVGGIAGAVAGFVIAADRTAAHWQAGNLPASEIAYLALGGVAFLMLVGGLLMGRKAPLLFLMLGFIAFGAALSGLVHDFRGAAANLVLWLSGFAFGGGVGIILARWLCRRQA